ncbi:hypothetical protein HNQ59_003436 [Chitinivorax tropicus]|uniref:DUF2946 domain-containing protein n=1 Tax=Chitinivorax tropicus TaxID=714531 RepID=A0A840MTK5_9PROT|nr:DUF2946 family protein [Chitinivorax tropicus]MBB5020122.1 hypothetical protein [Chitinivorax tropicus]
MIVSRKHLGLYLALLALWLHAAMSFLHGAIPTNGVGGLAFCGKLTPEIVAALADAPGGKPEQPAKVFQQGCPLCQQYEHGQAGLPPTSSVAAFPRSITSSPASDINLTMDVVQQDGNLPPPGRAPPLILG